MPSPPSRRREPSFFVAADWSKDARKRSVHVVDCAARRIGRSGSSDWDLGALLGLARGLRDGGPVLIGVDLALGVPAAYWTLARRRRRWQRANGLLDWLATLGACPGFWDPAAKASEWRVDRPFFRVPPGRGSLTAFRDKAGAKLLRGIDELTGAKSMFIVSGIPGSVGAATRDFWRELSPLLRADRDFAVWPFEGDLDGLLAERPIVLAEVYPALAYAVALADRLPTPRLKVGKTRSRARREVLDLLGRARWVREGDVDLGDLGPARRDEDAFDSHLTAAAALRCMVAGYPLGLETRIDPVAEGAILLSGAVDLERPARLFSTPAAPGQEQIGRREATLRR